MGMSDVEAKMRILSPQTCGKCGKQFGKTNLSLMGAEIWLSCDCMPADRMYCLNTKNVKWEGGIFDPKIGTFKMEPLDEAEYLDKVGNG
jgi:hypothetical protein